MDYIDKLNQLRYDKRLSYHELSLRCELSESAVKKILYKKCDPCIASIKMICAVLDANISDVFGSESEPGANKSDGDDSFIAIFAALPADKKSCILQIIKCFNK